MWTMNRFEAVIFLGVVLTAAGVATLMTALL
jgi:hypothetical protein